MTRILVSGDKHLGLVSDGMLRLGEQRKVIFACLDALREYNPDVYVDLGDLFNSSKPTPETYEVALDYFFELSEWSKESGGNSYLLTGNHDKQTRGWVHALTPLKSVELWRDGVVVVDQPKLTECGDFVLCFLPYVTNWEALETTRGLDSGEYLKAYAETAVGSGKRVLAFTHLEVPGAKVGECETVQRDVGLAIPSKLLKSKNVERIYAGHVHKFQELERVTVVGSSIYVDFGEAADPKGMILAEVE